MKLEAVILAAGAGSQMEELTRERPKCLLTVGNQSLIWFSITGLKSVGVTKILILVPDIYESEIRQYCHREFKSCKDLILEFVAIPTKDDLGTAQSILKVRDNIRGDFIVHSCDTIVDPKTLSFLVNHYRLYDPMMSMLLSDDAKYFQPRPVPGKDGKEHFMRDIIAVEPLDRLQLTANDGYSANKVVFLYSERDIEKNLRIRNRELALHPSLEIYSRFLDTHIYIFKHQMLDFIKQHEDIAFLKGEMIPLLISEQFSKLTETGGQDISKDDVDEVQPLARQFDYEIELKEKLENFNPPMSSRSASFRKANIPRPRACHSLIVKDLLAYRVNNLGSYLDSNCCSKAILNMYGQKDRKTVKECIIGENTIFGDKCQIKRGSIGSDCKIGDKVKLIDCIIMDNVEIGSDVNLTECIIGSDSKIGTKCNLKSCIVSYRQTVFEGRKARSEVIIDDGRMIDFSDSLLLNDE